MQGSVASTVSDRDSRPVPHETEQRFRDLIDVLPVAIYTTDAEGRLTHFNQAAVTLSGRVPELGSDRWCVSWKLYHPDGRPMSHDECPMAVALKEGRPVRGAEIIVERPDGKRIWCAPYPAPLFDGGGRVVGGVNMLLDLTERKLAEEVTAHLAAIVESSDDAIVSKDLNGVITSWNRGAESLFGFTAQEAIGQPITIIFPPDRLYEEPRILAAIRRGEGIDHYETVRRRKDGSLVDISLTVSPVRDQRGTVVGVSKIARDITARKRLAQVLREREERQRDDLEQALRTERGITAILQRSMLPDRLPRLDGINLAARYIPASPDAMVGGDFYDVFLLADGRLGVAIGDVAGHGFQAASAMGQVRMLLRAYGHEGHAPAAVLERLNRLLKADEMVTVLYLVLDPVTGQMACANAGHMPPLIVTRDGATRFLAGGDPPLLGGDYRYKSFTASIQREDTMILYTDGLVESDKSLDAGLARLAEVSAHAPSADLDEIATTIVAKVPVEGTRRRDDIAVLALRLDGPNPQNAVPRPSAED
jgi:PAS domain S-box-containing protein